MENDYQSYVSPLSRRYASQEMQSLFSEQTKAETFRKLWIILAEQEKALGLPITDEQIQDLKKYEKDIPFAAIEKEEALLRHDVMAQIKVYGSQAKKACGIIHLGATSAYVDDNTDILILKKASQLILAKVMQVLANLKAFAQKTKTIPTLGYTHLQPAQLTTVGKRATLWMNSFVLDVQNLLFQMNSLQPLGCKGTTGTQASFLDLFNGDEKKVRQLDERITKAMGFSKSVTVSGQTYDRKQDSYLLSVLSGIASSLYKFADDIRVLQSFGELEEPFESTQVGSSAMPYKRNPMRCERIAGLSRYVMIETMNPSFTASSQFLERTLDDSSNRRLTLAESFLALDGALGIAINVTDGIVVNRGIIEKRIQENLPFLASEDILMEAVKRGKDRQAIHEILREDSLVAAAAIKAGKPNPYLSLIKKDPRFGLSATEIDALLDPHAFIGLAPQQVTTFLAQDVDPLLRKYHRRKIIQNLRK